MVQYKHKCTIDFYSVYLASLDRLVDIMAREGALPVCWLTSSTEWTKLCMSLVPSLPHYLRTCRLISLCHLAGQKGSEGPEGAWRDTSKLAGLLLLGDLSERKVICGQLLASGDSQWLKRVMGWVATSGIRLQKAICSCLQVEVSGRGVWMLL